MLSITFPRRCCRNSKVCYFNMAEKIKFQFKGSVAVNILLEERIMWGSSDEPNNSPRPFGLEMPVWAFFWIKIAILVSNGENIFAEICLQFRKSNWFCFLDSKCPFLSQTKKKRVKVRTWEDSQISVLLISIRTFCSSSINLGNNWCRIQFVLMALSHFNLLKHNNLYHLNDLLFFFLLSYWPVDDRAHNPDEMKW